MIRSAALSDVGRRRHTNQDSYLMDCQSQLAVLADGMGGAGCGDAASKLTASTVHEFVQLAEGASEVTWPFGYDLQTPFEANVLRTAVLLANLKVCNAAEEMDQSAGMGSTVVIAWVRGDRLFWTHIGDSRIYLMRRGNLHQLSEDHTLVQEQLKRGIITPAEAKTHSMRHIVTRSMGSRERLELQVQSQLLETGDMILLCSDGLSNQLESCTILELLSKDRTIETICEDLIKAANDSGGDDNISVILLQYT